LLEDFGFSGVDDNCPFTSGSKGTWSDAMRVGVGLVMNDFCLDLVIIIST